MPLPTSCCSSPSLCIVCWATWWLIDNCPSVFPYLCLSSGFSQQDFLIPVPPCLCQSKALVNGCEWSLLWLKWLMCATKLASSACKQVLQTVAICGQSKMKNTLHLSSSIPFTTDRAQLGSDCFSWFRQKSLRKSTIFFKITNTRKQINKPKPKEKY